MERGIVGLFGGCLFGAGLGISGVGNPVVINNFLDLASPDLDFTLLILFMAALGTATLAYQTIFRMRERPLLERKYFLPERTDIDARLIVGSVIFGVGWALSGFCVGPALASAATLPSLGLPYLGAVAVGVMLVSLTARSRQPPD